VRNRLALLVLLPLAAAIALATARVDSLYQAREHYETASFQAGSGQGLENLMLALQTERQAAATCLVVVNPCDATAAAASGNQIAGTLVNGFDAAASETLTAQNALKAIAQQVINSSSYNPALRGTAAVAYEAVLVDLPNVRKVVTGSSAPYTVTLNAYSNTIDDVIQAISAVSSGSGDATVAQDDQALLDVDDMIEAQALGQLYATQVIDTFSYTGTSNTGVLQSQQATALNQSIASLASAQSAFASAASPALLQSYQATVAGADVAESQAALTASLGVLQGSTAFGSTNLSATGGAGNEIQEESLPVTIGDMRAIQAAALDQVSADVQGLLSSANSDLYLNLGLVFAALLVSFLGMVLVARSLVGPLQALRAGALDIAANRLPEVVRRLRDADAAEGETTVDPIPINSADEIGQVARAFDEVHQQAVRLASEQALLRSNVNSMFVNLSRRSQSLVQRQLRLIDELENSEQDPDQLANLFKLDHLATRMRRNGENLLVLAGEEPGRKWSQAVRLLDVMRAGASEVEQYERVALRDLPDMNVLGRVVNDLVHLVAELLENATSFSAPETKVSVTANMLNTGGVMLEIEDAGIGMTPEELDDANERLANPPVIDVAISRRMGLYVVGRLATRHGIQVRLRRSAGGGITALVLVPSALLVGAGGEQQAPAPELSATGARSLGALPRRGSTQLGFAGEEGAAAPQPPRHETVAPAGEGAAAPPYRGAAPAGLGSTDPFAPAQPPSGPDGPAPIHPLTPVEPAPAAEIWPPTGLGGVEPLPSRADSAAQRISQNPPAGAGAPGAGGTGTGNPLPPPSIPGARAPIEDLPPQVPPLPQPWTSGQFPRVQDSDTTGPIPRIKDGDTSGRIPRVQDPAASGQFPRIQDPEATGRIPRVRDGASQGPSDTGQFPLAQDPAPQQGADPLPTRQVPSGRPAPAPLESLLGEAPPPQQMPPIAPIQPALGPGPRPPQLPMSPMPSAPQYSNSGSAPADPLSASGSYPTAADRLFAQTPLPPAPSTDERLPIFEAMESEWFRRRDEARAQAALSAPPPLPLAPGVRPAPGVSSYNPPTAVPPAGIAPTASAAPAAPAVTPPMVPTSVPPTPQPPSISQPPRPAPADADRPGLATAGVSPDAAEPRAAVPNPPRPAPPSPVTAAPTVSLFPPQDTGGPVRPLPPLNGESSAAASTGGVRPLESSTAWTSPGDEGWKAAQAAAKPVAAGLTQKGLPKRVPRSNLVPGSAGGMSGPARAVPPPVIPTRSAEAVRGRLSSFHKGLKQGRDAALGGPNEDGSAGDTPPAGPPAGS
jgi:signal transduction histidine kinase